MRLMRHEGPDFVTDLSHVASPRVSCVTRDCYNLLLTISFVALNLLFAVTITTAYFAYHFILCQHAPRQEE